jgi:amidase
LLRDIERIQGLYGRLNQSPAGCGSSTGSGVAVAADLCVAAIGSETDGSITCPAAINGIVGLKPTLGLVSRSGIIPIAHSQDTAGPMARSVTDAAILLGALAGEDARDPATAVGSRQLPVSSKAENLADDSPFTDYTQFLHKEGLHGARIGVARQYFGMHPQVDEIMEARLAAMRGLGAEVLDLAAPLPDDEIGEHEIEVLLYEFKAGLDAYLAGLGPDAPVKSMADVIAFDDATQIG